MTLTALMRDFAAPLLVVLLMFAPASFAQKSADRIDVEQAFVFEDAMPPQGKEIVLPWTDAEKDEITRCLKLAAAGIPGAVESALNGNTISVYRICYPTSPTLNPGLRKNSDVLAYSVRLDKHNQGRCQIYVCDRFFRSDLDSRGFDQHAWVIAHELGHLSDPGNRVDDSSEWKHLIMPRIIQARLLARATMSMPELDNLCVRCGLPSRIAAQGSHEALAEFVATRCFNQEFQPSAEIDRILNDRIFHQPAQNYKVELMANRDELVEECRQELSASQEQLVDAGLRKHDSNERLARKFYKHGLHCADGDVQTAVTNFELAVCLDKNKLLYQKALSEARFRRGSRLLEQQNFKSALIQFRKAVGADPQNYLASAMAHVLAPKLGRYVLGAGSGNTIVDSYALQINPQPQEAGARPVLHASLHTP